MTDRSLDWLRQKDYFTAADAQEALTHGKSILAYCKSQIR